MKTDPRLAEINFLSRLDAQDASSSLSVSEWHESCGLSHSGFKDMVFALFAEACIVSTNPLGLPGTTANLPATTVEEPRMRIYRANENELVRLNKDQVLVLSITHFGRLRLWRLRDELEGNRIRESFGILIDGRHFDDDLRIRFWMASEGEPVGVLMADLDHFKAVNDRIDHLRGDEAIRRYLEIVRGVATGCGGEAYRKGGDETLAILPGLDQAALKEVAEALRAAVEAEFKSFDERLAHPPTASIGASSFKKQEAPEEVRRVVDGLMIRAKRSGRNRVEVE